MISRVFGLLKPAQIVLDIGCGTHPQQLVDARLHICCEPDARHVQTLQAGDGYISSKHVLLQAEALDALRVMPDKSVDSVFLLDVLPYLDHRAGETLLAECARVASSQIVVRVDEQQCEHADSQSASDYETVRSSWGPMDFDPSWEVLAPASDRQPCTFWAVRDFGVTYDRLPAKLAIVSPVFPPDDSGQAVMLSRLFGRLRPEDTCLISATERPNALFPYSALPSLIPGLTGRYYILDIPNPGQPGLRYFPRVVNFIRQYARRIRQIVEQERCDGIIGCSGDFASVPAAYLASLLTGRPLYLYMFDHYRYQSDHPLYRRVAARIERWASRHAERVIVPNEYMAQTFQEAYDIEPAVVHNPLDISQVDAPDEQTWPASDDAISIVYTGQVYEAQYDALERLVQAMRILEAEVPLKLHMYTAQPRSVIEAHGIAGPVEFHGYLPHEEIRQVQAQADILFLPLAFDSPYPELIRTAAPSKFGEYLASGRPILAHTPPGFIQWYLDTHQCGYAVHEPDVSLLAEAIREIAGNAAQRQQFQQNAIDRAREDYVLGRTREKLFEVFKGAARGAEANVMKRILYVGLPNNMHAVRQIHALIGDGWDVHVFPSYTTTVHPEMKDVTTYYLTSLKGRLPGQNLRIRRLLPLPNRLSGLLERAAFKLSSGWRERWLARLIHRIKPAVIYSQTFFGGGYLTLDAKRIFEAKYRGERFPLWIASNWGIDIDYLGRLQEHKPRIQAVLEESDYYVCECERDVELARELGFKGEVLPVLPIGGGFDLEQIRRNRRPEPPSKRRTILIKGYENLVGRAAVALRACELNAERLGGYEVAIILADANVPILAELFSEKTGIPTRIVKGVAYEDILKLYGSARVYIGLSEADGISTSLLEAMAMGAFPIQSDTACADEWIEDGKTALLVHPNDSFAVADALRRALEDDGLVDAAAPVNMQTIDSRLDNEIIRDTLVKAYEEIYQAARQRARSR